MKERPILFSGSMVKAILDDRKTQTRRVVKPPSGPIDPPKGWYLAHYQNTGEWSTWANETDCGTLRINNPYGEIGDRLWVRETFLLRHQGETVDYRADLDPCEAAGRGGLYGGWKPSIFMPRAASRITLEITSVKVERVGEISPSDAKAEGSYRERCECLPRNKDKTPLSMMFRQTDCHIHGQEFSHLWDSINGKKHPWSSNPWVWVISFSKL